MNGKLEHLFDMEYLKQLFEEHKEDFEENEIYNEQDLEDYLLATMKSNVSYDFNVKLEIEKLLNNRLGKIYINRLGLYFESNEDLCSYVKRHYDIFTKEELKYIILKLAE